MGEWFAEFAATLPEAARALYQFGDPAGIGRGWVGFAIMALWFGPLFALPLWLAKLTYGTREWVSATMGIMAAGTFLWWLHGIIPHGWILFAESNQALLGGTLIPESFTPTLPNGTELDLASNLYAVVVESVVGGLMVGGIVVTLWVFLRVQKAVPKTLAAGETKPESGGYK